jgi:hypothetical protein
MVHLRHKLSNYLGRPNGPSKHTLAKDKSPNSSKMFVDPQHLATNSHKELPQQKVIIEHAHLLERS